MKRISPAIEVIDYLRRLGVIDQKILHNHDHTESWRITDIAHLILVDNVKGVDTVSVPFW